MDNKRRNYFKNKANFDKKKQKVQFVEPGLKGFLCTCNFQEKNCVREAYNLLNEFADRLYGAEAPTKEPVEEDAEEDVSDALQKQIADIKSEGAAGARRFQSLMSGATNCVFIRADVEDTVHLGHSIVASIAETKVQRTRFLLRLIPVEATCSIKLSDVVDTAKKLFDKHFSGEPTTFSIVFNKRLNNSPRDIIIKELADLVVAKNPLHKVDLQNAKLSVIVEMIKGICMMSVVPDYFALKKYNIMELCAPPKEKSEGATPDVEGEQQPEEVDNEKDEPPSEKVADEEPVEDVP